MRRMPLLSITCASALAFLAAPADDALAQSYPSKTIRYVVGFPAGSSVDVVPRMVMEEIRRNTGATIVVENRPGALGFIAMEQVARAERERTARLVESGAVSRQELDERGAAARFLFFLFL